MTPHKKHTQEDNVDSWLMSYADMITLLMCFFIIFVAVSEPKTDKLNSITEGLAHKFGAVDLSTPFEGVFRSMQTVVEEHRIFKDVAITKNDQTVDIELSSGRFFENDSAALKQDMVPILSELVAALKTASFVEYRIVIEGHTSDQPIHSGLFPTNWELSSARADRMVRFFIEQGVPAKCLRAVGFADTQPKVSNTDGSGNPIPENREQNQRIVIRFERIA